MHDCCDDGDPLLGAHQVPHVTGRETRVDQHARVVGQRGVLSLQQRTEKEGATIYCPGYGQD